MLDRMEEVMPHKVLPLDFPVKSRVAQMYEMAGDQDKYREYSGELVSELEPQAAKGFSEGLASEDAYVILLQAYEAVGKYDQALNLLETIRKVYATTRGVDQFVQQQKARLEALKMAKDSTSQKK